MLLRQRSRADAVDLEILEVPIEVFECCWRIRPAGRSVEILGAASKSVIWLVTSNRSREVLEGQSYCCGGLKRCPAMPFVIGVTITMPLQRNQVICSSFALQYAFLQLTKSFVGR